MPASRVVGPEPHRASDPGPAASAAPVVVVAIATYLRTESLALMVQEVLAQAAEVNAQVRVLVIDNDPAASARAPMAELVGEGLTYVHEPRPGLAAVRNRAIDESAAADALVFIDDDETPGSRWLARLLETWAAHGADAVAGPAVRVLPAGASAWVQACGHFDRRRRVTGSSVPGAATNNLLLDRRAVRRLGLRFDERFGLSGGEDTLFTRTLVRRGGIVVWSDDAEVLDPVPADRATPRWVLRRDFRTGTTWSRVHVALAADAWSRAVQRAELVAHGTWLLVRGAVAVLVGAVGGSGGLARRARGARRVASGLGVLLGVAGLTFEEYARAS